RGDPRHRAPGGGPGAPRHPAGRGRLAGLQGPGHRAPRSRGPARHRAGRRRRSGAGGVRGRVRSPMDTAQFCTLYLENACYGIEVTRVQEIIRYQHLTRVPLAPGVVAGLMNLRGQIVTAIDLRRRLSLPAREGARLPTNVVVQGESGVVSLLVDEVGDVLTV